MTLGSLVKAIVVLVSLVLIIGIIRSLAKRVLTDSFSLLWIAVSLGMLAAGVFIPTAQWNRMLDIPGADVVLGSGACVLSLLYYLSVQISVLQRKNQELAMRLSLMMQENEEILKNWTKYEEKNTFCN